jgi:hypothetical protein
MLRLYRAAGLQPKGDRLHWQEIGAVYSPSLDEVIMSEVSQMPSRSAPVGFVGGLNIVLGLFGLFAGLFLLLEGPDLLPVLGVSLVSPTTPAAAPGPFGPATPVVTPGTPPPQFLLWLTVTAAGIGLSLLALGLLIAGLALLRRLPWGRTLTLTIALFSGPVALISLLNQEVVGASAAAIYNVLVFAVLLTPRCAAEFGPRRPRD